MPVNERAPIIMMMIKITITMRGGDDDDVVPFFFIRPLSLCLGLLLFVACRLEIEQFWKRRREKEAKKTNNLVPIVIEGFERD